MIKNNIKINGKIFAIIIFTIISIFLLSAKVEANNINSITMDVYIDNTGTAKITETWKVNLTKGTEGYKPYGKLGTSKIQNFTVTDDGGTVYTTLDNWNTSETFENKAYKCGLNKTYSGVELCWGISQYGSRTYTLKYDITNFVEQYKDSQGIYFGLIPKDMEQSVGTAKITIYSDTLFTSENAQIWAFGYNGDINFVNGKIIMDSKGRLTSSNYMTALVKLPYTKFSDAQKVNKTFDEIYEDAMSTVKYNKSSRSEEIAIIIPVIMGFSIYGGIFLLIYFSTSKTIKKVDTGEPLPKRKDVGYYRDIPCKKDLCRAYWVMKRYGLVDIETLQNGIVGAILLKWIKDGLITITKTRSGLFDFMNNDYAICLNKDINMKNKGITTDLKGSGLSEKISQDNEDRVTNEIKESLKVDGYLEKVLYSMFNEASGRDSILEAKEMKRWCRKNYKKFKHWFESILEYEDGILEKDGLVIKTRVEYRKFLKKHILLTTYYDDELRENAINIMGLKNYLKDYGSMNSKEAMEVEVWEEYLMFAQLLGIADEVEEQLKDLYPDFSQFSKINLECDLVCTRNMVDLGMLSARKGERAARLAESFTSGGDYSSGGGGSSFSSGGSSARGSSSGGGFR